MKNISNQNDSLFRTNVKTSEKFKAYADIQTEKRREKERKELIDEINRRSLEEGSYDV